MMVILTFSAFFFATVALLFAFFLGYLFGGWVEWQEEEKRRKDEGKP